MRSKQGMPYSCRGEGFCLRAAQDEVSTERPGTIRKRTYLQHNIPLLQTINSVIKKADIPLFSNVSDTTKVITLSLPSFSIHCQEMSAVPLSPSHCTCKELSASSDADSADSCLSDSSIGGGDNERWAALSSASLGQFKCRMEYIEADLQGELAEAFSLSMNTEELKLPNNSHFESPTLKVATIVAHKSHALPKGHASTGVVGLCINECRIGDWKEEPIITCLDLGSDLMLLSKAVLTNLKRPPCIHSVKGFQLKGVMGEVRVKGYVNLRLWLQSKDGTWVEFLEEAWVLKDLKVPLLLGEDFHINYCLSTVRDDHGSLATMLLNGQLVMILAHSAPPEQPSWVYTCT